VSAPSKLMIYAKPGQEAVAHTRTGGRPMTPRGFAWPVCRGCEGNMMFIAQLRLADVADPELGDGLLLAFMCQNDPGQCDEWDATAGGNHAVVVPLEGLALLAPPPKGETLLGAASGVTYHPFDGDYNDARAAWGKRTKKQRDVLGHVGGEPLWIQADETPACGCGQPMRFVAMLEEGHDARTAANFGGGCAYAFACVAPACRGQARFLWQQ
jgi:hypothetical protein